MRRIILACALAGILSVPAKADETLKFRQVQHFTLSQTQPTGIPDDSNHIIGMNRQIGVLIFQDGSMAGTLMVIGIFDSVVGSGGTANGYGIVTFADGSEIWISGHQHSNSALPESLP